MAFSQCCGTIKNESCGDLILQRCKSVAFLRCLDVTITLPQRRHNIKHLVSRSFYYKQSWFLSRHRNVRELQKYLNIESSHWKVKCSLVNSWLCLLLVCEQDKVARVGAKITMKKLGRGKKRLQHNIVDLFPDIPTIADRWSIHSEWTHGTIIQTISMINVKHTHTHTKVLSGINIKPIVSL